MAQSIVFEIVADYLIDRRELGTVCLFALTHSELWTYYWGRASRTKWVAYGMVLPMEFYFKEAACGSINGVGPSLNLLYWLKSQNYLGDLIHVGRLFWSHIVHRHDPFTVSNMRQFVAEGFMLKQNAAWSILQLATKDNILERVLDYNELAIPAFGIFGISCRITDGSVNIPHIQNCELKARFNVYAPMTGDLSYISQMSTYFSIENLMIFSKKTEMPAILAAAKNELLECGQNINWTTTIDKFNAISKNAWNWTANTITNMIDLYDNFTPISKIKIYHNIARMFNLFIDHGAVKEIFMYATRNRPLLAAQIL